MDERPTEIVHAAVDELLLVVGTTAEDLRLFHAVLAKARLAPLPPFPRATLITIEHIIDDVKRVERDLRDVLVSLGLAG